MRLKRSVGGSLTLAAVAAVAALFVANAQGARTPSTLSFVGGPNQGREFLTAAGSSSVFPGRLQPGDRILSRDTFLQGSHSVGYDDEVCTMTVDNHFLCQIMVVLPGQGQVQASWLLLQWPDGYTGVINGGTGHFANAAGTFTYTPQPNGTAKITIKLK
jgi:hypothetical protein